MENKDYWIMDGSSSTYELKQEIKSYGGIWYPDFNCWKIKNINKESEAYINLKICGLNLQPV